MMFNVFNIFYVSLVWRLKLNKTNNMFNRLSIRHTLSSPLENQSTKIKSDKKLYNFNILSLFIYSRVPINRTNWDRTRFGLANCSN